MSTKDPNMKVIIGADTKDFDKGAKDVKQGLKDLSKTGDQAISSLGDAFGVNTGKVNQMVSAVRGLGARMTEASSTGVKAFGQLLGSITPLGGAIAGLGLAAAVAGFKALKAEADNFKSTIDGMNLSMATAAYISTYQQALHDINSETGRSVATAMSEWEKGLGRFKANFNSTMATFMTSSTFGDFIDSMRGTRQLRADARARAEEAERLGSIQADQMKEQLALDYEIRQVDYEIAALRREATDKTKSAADREAARVEYLNKVNEKYDKQRDLAVRMAQTQEQIDDLAANTFEDTKKTYELKGKILDIDAARENDLRAVDKLESNIASSAAAAAAAAQKQREEMQKIAEVQKRWSGLGTVSTSGLNPGTPGVSGPAMSILPRQEDVQLFKETLTAQLGDITIGIGVTADTEKIHDISNEINSLLQSGISRTGEILGNLIGTLAGGGDAWGDFKDAALSAFGDMAIAVGKIAIAAGLATEGIQAALKMGNPYVAIAAGAALVALGSAVKSSLSSAASGDYSAGGGGYSGGYSSAGSNGGGYETRDVKVYLTGTLEADGDKLITVINNTNNRNYYTK